MTPNQVRHRILAEHNRLRVELALVEDTARRTLNNPSMAAELLWAAKILARDLNLHIDYEDQVLVGAIREALPEVWANAYCAELVAHHAEQRQQLAEAIDEISATLVTPRQLARRVLTLVEEVVADMDEEESNYLGDELLDDNVVTILEAS